MASKRKAASEESTKEFGKMRNAKRKGARSGSPPEGTSPGVVPVDRTMARIYASLGTIALALSGYLVYTHFQLHRLATWTSLCNVSDTVSCDAVALSPYGTLMGFPLAGWGAWFYLVVTVGALLALRGWRVVRSPSLWLVAASGFSVGLSLGLAALSAFALRTWCPVCLALYGLNAGMLATAWRMFRRTGEGLRTAGTGELRYLRRHQGGIFLAAGAAMVVLGAAWIAYPKGFAPTVSVCKFLEERALKADGALPPAVIVVYSDFQCPHCATAHRSLKEARRGSVVKVESRHFPLDAVQLPRHQDHPPGRLSPGSSGRLRRGAREARGILRRALRPRHDGPCRPRRHRREAGTGPGRIRGLPVLGPPCRPDP